MTVLSRLLGRRSRLIPLIVCFNSACGNNPSQPEQFPTTTTVDYYAVWSAHHNLIAYIHDRIPGSDDPDSSGVYIIRPDGSEKRIFYRSELTYGIDWSQDGMWLLANSSGRLVRISYPDGQVDTLTPSGEYWSPVWSPDGQQIAFSEHLGDEAGVYIMNLHGGDPKLVVSYGIAVDWPLADSLLYINLDQALPLGAICMSDTSGDFKRTLYQVSEISPHSLAPRMHAITGRIAFHAQEYGDTESIWTLEPGSEQATQLRRFGLRPNFSPDGQKIVFTDTHKDNGRLWIMNWDGSGLRELTY
jgi:Tol biopolymer transport system component